MGEGKDRGKHDSGKDASGRVPSDSKHPDTSVGVEYQPESGVPVPDEKQAPGQRERTPSGENL
jgi:hypothetical protein